MSDTPAGPLWTDEEIRLHANNLGYWEDGEHHIGTTDVVQFVKFVREQEREPLLARIAELQRELDAARGERDVPQDVREAFWRFVGDMTVDVEQWDDYCIVRAWMEGKEANDAG